MTTTMTATAPPAGPRASRIPGPDLTRIKAEEAAKVNAELGRLRNPEEIARRAAAIMAEVAPVLHESERLRDAAAMSLHVYYGTRGLARLTGLTRTTLHKKRVKATEANTPFVENAADVLVVQAERAARALWRNRAAMHYRDDAAKALTAMGWTKPRIAAIIGRVPSRVSHITTGGGE